MLVLTIIVRVWITQISHAVIIRVCLIRIGNGGTVVTGVTLEVAKLVLSVWVQLIGVSYERTIVLELTK